MTPQLHYGDKLIVEDYDIVYKQELLPSMSPTELKEVFPEALPIIKKNLAIYKKYYKEVEPLYNELLDILLEHIYGTPDSRYDDPLYPKTRALAWASQTFYKNPLGEIEANIKKLSHLESVYLFKETPGRNSITDADIENAKRVPIQNFVEVNRAGFTRCLFHNEKTASCKIFADNKFRCFGCEANGDVIDLIRKLQNLEFHAAVRFLLQR